MNKLQYLIIHCTATKEGVNVTPSQIERWHKGTPPNGRGWDRVGYSKLILLSGTVHSFVNEDDDEFVDNWEITYGAVGMNSKSRHICYVGGLASDAKTPKDTRTPEQEMALAKIVLETIAKYPDIKVAGHYHFANKACPSFDVENWLKLIKVPEKNIYKK